MLTRFRYPGQSVTCTLADGTPLVVTVLSGDRKRIWVRVTHDGAWLADHDLLLHAPARGIGHDISLAHVPSRHRLGCLALQAPREVAIMRTELLSRKEVPVKQ